VEHRILLFLPLQCIYIYRERERERERLHLHSFIFITLKGGVWCSTTAGFAAELSWLGDRRSKLTKTHRSVMGSDQEAPLLLPAPEVGGCPGCLMERRKALSNGRIPYKEFFFVGVTTLASCTFICLHLSVDVLSACY
jgi:hypothetical protein